MAKSRKMLLSRLRHLHQERRRLIRLLTSGQELAVGTVALVHRKCGNPRCHCASGKGHPQLLFLYKDDQGQRRCKLVRRADEARLFKAGERYRKWRRALKQLRAIENRQRELLLALREEKAIRYE